MRLTRSRRLNQWSEFHRVRTKGRAHRGRHFLLGVLEEPEEASFRIGFITTKRLGNAVTRNRVRRRLRAIVRETPPLPGHHYVIVARDSSAQASSAELTREWKRLAKKAGVLAPTQAS